MVAETTALRKPFVTSREVLIGLRRLGRKRVNIRSRALGTGASMAGIASRAKRTLEMSAMAW